MVYGDVKSRKWKWNQMTLIRARMGDYDLCLVFNVNRNACKS